MLLHRMTLTSIFKIGSGMCTYIVYDHEAEHSISDVPKHSSDVGHKPPWIPLVKSSPPPESWKSNTAPPPPPPDHLSITFCLYDYFTVLTILLSENGVIVINKCMLYFCWVVIYYLNDMILGIIDQYSISYFYPFYYLWTQCTKIKRVRY